MQTPAVVAHFIGRPDAHEIKCIFTYLIIK
jgi:hypothetical protein